MSFSVISQTMSEYELDLCDMEPPKRHPTIMKAFEAIPEKFVARLPKR